MSDTAKAETRMTTPQVTELVRCAEKFFRRRKAVANMSRKVRKYAVESEFLCGVTHSLLCPTTILSLTEARCGKNRSEKTLRSFRARLAWASRHLARGTRGACRFASDVRFRYRTRRSKRVPGEH